MRLELAEAPRPAEARAVKTALLATNAAAGFPYASRRLVLLLRDADGAVAGGLLGRTQRSWLYVEKLAVRPALRGQGWGARLLAAAEAEARARSAVGAWLETYSFQGPGFYARQGYGVAGRIDGCPPGATRFTMVKRLDGGGEKADVPP